MRSQLPATPEEAAIAANQSDGATLRRLLPYIWQYKWHALAALLFGFFRALGNVYTGFSFLKAMNLPSSLYNMLPYIISLIVLAFTSKNSRAPKAEGIPYDKGSR